MANTFINRISGSIGTTETTIYTTPAVTTTTVIGVAVSNRVQSNILVDVKLVESGSLNTAFLCTGSLIPPGSNIILVGGEQKVVMETGDRLTLRSNVASSVDIVLSALEIS
jgi:hypothetical protein